MMNLPSLTWKDAGQMNMLSAGHPLNRSFYLFEKIEDSVIEAQVKKLRETKKINEPQKPEVKPQKPLITYDDFTRMDIRLGTILDAKKVPQSDKLLELRIDTGIDQRTVVAGIATQFGPEEIIGKQVCFLVNLEPRTLRGLTSEGMILMAEGPDGKLAFLIPSRSLPDGSDVK
jgi:methionyl-tRNA synthetase